MTAVVLAVQFAVQVAQQVSTWLACADCGLRLPKEWPPLEATE